MQPGGQQIDAPATNRDTRNAAICAMYRSGHSLAAVGSSFGLTRQNIHAVLKRCGEPVRDRVSALQACWQNPAFRARNAAAARALWQDAAFRTRIFDARHKRGC